MAEDSEIFGAVVAAVSGLVLVHSYVEDPMQAVFDAPMPSGCVSESRNGHCRTKQVVNAFGCDFAFDFAGSGDLADGSQTRPVMCFLQPGNVSGEGGRTGFDTAMIAINHAGSRLN